MPEVEKCIRGFNRFRQQCLSEPASVLHPLDNLLIYPWIRRRVEAGSLMLHGWYFDIEPGVLFADSPRAA